MMVTSDLFLNIPLISRRYANLGISPFYPLLFCAFISCNVHPGLRGQSRVLLEPGVLQASMLGGRQILFG